jgi:hypothetical protein
VATPTAMSHGRNVHDVRVMRRMTGPRFSDRGVGRSDRPSGLSPRGSSTRLLASALVVVLFATACQKDEELGLVNSCSVSFEVEGPLGEGQFGWIELEPGEAAFVGVYSIDPERTYDMRARGARQVLFRVTEEQLVEGDSGDWDREFVVSGDDCQTLD